MTEGFEVRSIVWEDGREERGNSRGARGLVRAGWGDMRRQ